MTLPNTTAGIFPTSEVGGLEQVGMSVAQEATLPGELMQPASLGSRVVEFASSGVARAGETFSDAAAHLRDITPLMPKLSKRATARLAAGVVAAFSGSAAAELSAGAEPAYGIQKPQVVYVKDGKVPVLQGKIPTNDPTYRKAVYNVLSDPIRTQPWGADTYKLNLGQTCTQTSTALTAIVSDAKFNNSSNTINVTIDDDAVRYCDMVGQRSRLVSAIRVDTETHKSARIGETVIYQQGFREVLTDSGLGGKNWRKYNTITLPIRRTGNLCHDGRNSDTAVRFVVKNNFKANQRQTAQHLQYPGQLKSGSKTFRSDLLQVCR